MIPIGLPLSIPSRLSEVPQPGSVAHHRPTGSLMRPLSPSGYNILTANTRHLPRISSRSQEKYRSNEEAASRTTIGPIAPISERHHTATLDDTITNIRGDNSTVGNSVINKVIRTKQLSSNRRCYLSRRKNQHRSRQRRLSSRESPEEATATSVPPDQDFGDPLRVKPSTHARIAFGNINGFTEVHTRNPKAAGLRQFIRSHEIDCFGGAEPNINWTRMKRHQQLKEMFRTENATRSITAHNSHDNVHTYQHGGSFLVCNGEMAKRVVETGKDPSGLGRWTWLKFVGQNNHKTRIISVYIPHVGDRTKLRTVYAQQARYWESKRKQQCPRELLYKDLFSLLCQWRTAGERILMLVDANEDVRNGILSKLVATEGLEMHETIQARHHSLPTTGSHINGREPIDGIFATPDLPISKGALLAFDKNLGDHRFAYIDIAWDVLLGTNTHRIVRPDARRLNCKLPQVLQKYNKSVVASLRKERYQSRVYNIQQLAVSPELSTELQIQLIQLDDERVRIMLRAERKCRKLNMGKVDYSPIIADARNAIELWRNVHKKKTGHRVSSKLIKRLAKKCHVLFPMSVSVETSHNNLTRAKDHYLKTKPLAQNLREDWLRYRSTDDTLDETSRKAARRMIREELQRETAASLRFALGTARGGSVRQVTTTDIDGNETIHTDEQSVINVIMATNEARFRLTENTPPMMEPLRSELGLLGNTSAAEQILNGTYIAPPDLDPWTRQFITDLQRSTQAGPSISPTITAADYQKFWRSARERTSSSPSGLHFGHWKAAASDDYISECHAITTELAYSSGFSLPRWQVGLSVMLEKTPGDTRPDKLRAISLLEADFNYANRLIFNLRMMRQAEAKSQIPNEVFGARNSREAIEVALNRKLILDISRQRRWPLAIASVDAQSCYDRIAHSIASICCQRWDVGPNLLASLLTTIQLMQFHLRTAFGDSESTYGGTPLSPFQGTCQGNPAAGAIWTAISSVLVDAQHRLGHFSTFESAINNVIIPLAGFLFVDDTELLSFPNHPGTQPAALVHRLQAQVQTWQANLWATGGALRAEKCTWSIAAYKFVNGHPLYHTTQSLTLPPLLIVEPNGQPVPIRCIPADEPTKVLGVVQAVNGSMEGQLCALSAMAAKLGQNIWNSSITPKVAWLGFWSMIWAKLKYCLPVTTFTCEE